MTKFEKRADGAYVISGMERALVGTVGREINRVDYTLDPAAIRHEEKALLAPVTGLPGARIVMLQQVHGDTIVDMREPPGEDLPWIAEADALVTALGGLCLVIRTADCIPVFILDPVRRVLGAAHSGWKGTKLEIARLTTRFMKERYGSDPANLRAFVLPGIGPRSYAVNEDVACLFPNDTETREGRIYLDLWRHIARSLAAEGVHPDSIFMTGICTLENWKSFFTHRGGDAGRNLNFGALFPA
ncbi:MAG: laccase domain-containing protein [Spirochaetes bacterium]|nr:MAG: laccase domain-containing protein [Spirochaetota bacterium]